VPESVGRPLLGPTDEQWVMLYDNYKLLKGRSLKYSKDPIDYNHLIFTGDSKTK
jgi:hypothetical protein